MAPYGFPEDVGKPPEPSTPLFSCDDDRRVMRIVAPLLLVVLEKVSLKPSAL
jgi:hypothetical protein